MKSDREEIKRIVRFRHGDYYIGGMGCAAIHGLLGTRYGTDDIQKAIDTASDKNLERVSAYLDKYGYRQNYYRLRNKPCPCCGQPLPEDRR